jgi:hypothetical protein
LLAIGGGNVNPRSLFAGDQAEGQAKHAAGEPLSILHRRDSIKLQVPVGQPVQLQRLFLSIDKQQFFDSDIGIKLELVATAIVWTCDFNCEVRSAAPMRATVFSFCVRSKRDDVRTSIIVFPLVLTIAHIHARPDLEW